MINVKLNVVKDKYLFYFTRYLTRLESQFHILVFKKRDNGFSPTE